MKVYAEVFLKFYKQISLKPEHFDMGLKCSVHKAMNYFVPLSFLIEGL